MFGIERRGVYDVSAKMADSVVGVTDSVAG